MRIPGTRGGGSVLKAPSAAEGALPRLRCPVKPRLLLTNPASASAPNAEPNAEPHQSKKRRHRKPPPSCSELQYGGGFTYAPCRCILNNSKPTSYGLAGRPRRDVLREQGRLHLTELIKQAVHKLRRIIC